MAMNKTVLLKVANNDYYAKSAVRRGKGDIVERNVTRLLTDPTVKLDTYAPVTEKDTYKKKSVSALQVELSASTLIALKKAREVVTKATTTTKATKAKK